MATLNLSLALKNARAQAILTALGTSPTVQFRTGAVPASPATAASGTLLGTCTCAAVPGTVSNGVLTFAAITSDASADASGAWGYARFLSGSTAVLDVDVGVAGSGATIIADAESCVAGAALNFNSFTITEV